MRKTVLIAGAAFVAAGLVACQAEKKADFWFDGSFDNAVKEASAENTLVMMDFYTDW